MLSLLMAIAGCVLLAILPIDGWYRKTYISENALLPGQANTYFRESEWNVVRGYRSAVRELENTTEIQRVQKVSKWLQDTGLKTSTDDWSAANGPKGLLKNGTNLYAILNAPRGDHTGAMVLIAPWYTGSGVFNDGGVSVCIALARYFTRWTIWSKNIIFVFPSDSRYALRSWVSAYHTSLDNTAGAIEGALVLEYTESGDYIEGIDVIYEGLNGHLPNLDLVNSVILIAQHEGMPVSVQGMRGQHQSADHANLNTYLNRLKCLFRGISAQLLAGLARGVGSENFSGWRIDAVTIRAFGSKGPCDITTFGRVAESTFRSINNLLEHFHQSFFFYLLLGPSFFVSISTFLPPGLLLSNSFSLLALSQGLRLRKPYSIQQLLSAGIVMGVTYFCSIGLSLVSFTIAHSAIGLWVFALMSVVTVPYLHLRSTTILVDEGSSWIEYLKCATLLVHGLALTTLCTVHFSLALALAVLTLPLPWLVGSSLNSFTRSLGLLMLSPTAMLLVLSIYLSWPFSSLLETLIWSWHDLNLWTWGCVIGIWFPFWQSFVIVSSVREASKKKND